MARYSSAKRTHNFTDLNKKTHTLISDKSLYNLDDTHPPITERGKEVTGVPDFQISFSICL